LSLNNYEVSTLQFTFADSACETNQSRLSASEETLEFHY